MQLSAYNGLISHLPYLEQAFETKKETWDREQYQEHEEFNQFLADIFAKDDVATFSRQDLFNTVGGNIKATIFSIIFWGYPRNMRGNTFESILKVLPDIERLLSGNRALDIAALTQICRQLKGCGIGLSTLTKFLYFFGFTLNGYRCLILDRRIVEVLNAGTFAELSILGSITEYNKERAYPAYLRIMHQLSEKNGYSVDQLELFLFQFGRNLKAAAL
ncbi:MAG: hypothetical protein JST68_21585 [Bacteroidetes bacterium]|nr:hypothetical protein [Bacteroidota bacterium]